MGIENFGQAYLTVNGRNFIYTGRKRVSTVSIDMNAMIYNSLDKVPGMSAVNIPQFHANGRYKEYYTKFCEILFSTVVAILNSFPPEDAVYFAFDGPTPAAKIAQQRERRFVPNPTYGSYIAPGTKFMVQIHDLMERGLIPFLDGEGLLPPVTLYSSCFEPGEGEHKIMDYYRSIAVNGKSEAMYAKGIHCLWSPDADLTMLALVSPLNNIVFMRHLQFEGDGGKIVDKDVNYDIELAKDHILKQHSLTPTEFTFLFFFFGNDFLPRQFLFTNDKAKDYITLMLNYFASVDPNRSEPLISYEGRSPKINMAVFSAFLDYMAQQEVNYFPEIARAYGVPFQEAFDRQGIPSIPLIETIWSGSASPFAYSNFTQEQNTILANLASYSENYGDVSYRQRRYLDMLKWNLVYYTQGTMAVNHDLLFPFVAAPSFREMHVFLQTGIAVASEAHLSYPEMVVFNVSHQMLASIPAAFSVDNVPGHNLRLYSIESSVADYTQVVSYKKDQFGRILQSPIDRWRIITALMAYPPPGEEAKILAPRPTLYHVLTQERADEYIRKIKITVERPEDRIIDAISSMSMKSAGRGNRGRNDRNDFSRNDRNDRGGSRNDFSRNDRGGSRNDRGGSRNDRGGGGFNRNVTTFRGSSGPSFSQERVPGTSFSQERGGGQRTYRGEGRRGGNDSFSSSSSSSSSAPPSSFQRREGRGGGNSGNSPFERRF